MENTLIGVLNEITTNPIGSTIDFATHLTSGYLAAEIIMPKDNPTKKFTYGIAAGFLPDLDFLTFGIIPHRIITHTIPAALTIPLLAPPYKSAKNWMSSKINSPEFQTLTAGVLMHIAADSIESNLVRIAYTGLAATSAYFLSQKSDIFTQAIS